MGRLFFLLIVVLGLTPGTWLRTPTAPKTDQRQILSIERLQVPETDLGAVKLVGAWQLESPNMHFGGYSGLAPLGHGMLLAVTDHGRMLRLEPPGGGTRPTFWFDQFVQLRNVDKRFADIEGVTRDPATGMLWITCETLNQVERYDAGLFPTGSVRPAGMQSWPSNTGPESIVRLADGRFIVVSEGNPRWFASTMPAMLFDGDPVDGARVAPFRFRPPTGYRAVDMALLPDGRVLILLRQMILGLPPRFESKLVLADPAEIRAGETWSGREIVHLTEPVPMDNYEALAIEPAADGSLVLWLLSDNNLSAFQRTLLLKLRWPPDAKSARESTRAPS